MRKHYLTVCLVVLMACAGDDTVPQDIIQPDLMVAVLTDVHQADAKVSNLKVSEDSAQVIMRHYDLAIWKKFNVSEENYLESFQWYLEHPVIYKDVYARVVDSLSMLEELLRESTENAARAAEEENALPVPNMANRQRLPAENDGEE